VSDVVAFSFLDHDGPIAYAHRGGAAEAPENSLAAFARAVSLGYRYLETDARLSADGVLVCMHDDNIGRVSDRAGAVAELTYAELAAARLRAPDGSISDQRIPRLEDVFAAWPTARVNVDAKEDRATAPLADLVARIGAVDRVCLGAFSDDRLSELRSRLGAGLCTSLGPLSVKRLRARSVGLRAAAVEGAIAQVPVRTTVHLGPLPIRVPIVDRRFLRAAERDGVAVHVWTVDRPAEMNRLLDLGVTGLMTDVPTTLRDVLSERGQWG
jgi:glycerophosphoryl diester phosphodiesterase